MGKIIDLTGQRFNKLTVIEKTPERKNRQVVWKCQCDCGKITYVVGQALRTGHTKSCGCLNHEKKDSDSLIGKTFGKLTVIKRSDFTYNNKIYWTCECDCGCRLDVSGTDLRNLNITSCNSCKEDKIWNDLSYQKFGLLTTICPTGEKQNSHIVWKCKCECGNFCEVNANSLKTGNTSSCGCLSKKSIGEEKISKFLKEKNINFKRQFSFSDCLSPKNFPLLFDFAIFDKNNDLKCLVEYDGIQHFKPIEYFGGKEYFDYLQYCDEKKDSYCKENNIPLLRIYYKEINNVEKYIEEFLLNVNL